MYFPVHLYFAFRQIAAYSEQCKAKAPIKPPVVGTTQCLQLIGFADILRFMFIRC